MRRLYFVEFMALLCVCAVSRAKEGTFDAAPFGLPLPDGNGIQWEDPREVHQVVVEFAATTPSPTQIRLQYWGSRWPEQHLPKDREPGGGDVGWMELGNWHRGDWRTADANAVRDGSKITFTFRPVNAKEYPKLKDYPAEFRYTLKLRVVGDEALPKIERIRVLTDSTCVERTVQLAWKSPLGTTPKLEAFNGHIERVEKAAVNRLRVRLQATANSDPNTFDRTLVTVHNGGRTFTFAVDDLDGGALCVPHFGAAVLKENDSRDYAAVAAEHKGLRTLYDEVAARPEQTWAQAWAGIPRKKSRIYLPLGLEGGRQRFRLDADGTVRFRYNDNYLRARRGRDTPRLDLEAAPVECRFGPTVQPAARELEESCLPICHAVFENNGIQTLQTAFVTKLEGTKAGGPVPAADALAVYCARFVITNTTPTAQTVTFPLTCHAGGKLETLRIDDRGFIWVGDRFRGQAVAAGRPESDKAALTWSWTLAPGQSQAVVVKIPYLVLTEPGEREALAQLEFEAERMAVRGYWQRRQDLSSRLVTPEPVLDDFYRSHARHLLINSEREPASTRRFARVGSFGYGAYGNESCMMVVDLDRRGYHREAEECLDAWLYYQGTVGLPGSFASKEGVLYGAGGYEAGGYNQHHGWILWCLAEHYRFTRDDAWLRRAAPGILAGAKWIIRETDRTATRHELERGLLPAGSLEDIGDWWTWLSTSCYTWRGLDSAAWALEQLKHPEAARVRNAADAFHNALMTNFRAAMARSPVVRLRDGSAVPHFPSQVHRRGRSFGWICETLEGALHLLITGALDPRSPEAEWIIKDYEDNLYLSNQYGYTIEQFDRDWFSRGGMSMQACLLLDVEPYLYRDDVKHALRALFNGLAVSHFPDVHMNTEHALPNMDDWRGDHFKSSDEANACGWLRQLFVREQGDALLLGQAVPRDWLKPGQRCGLERAASHFGPLSVDYTGEPNRITARVEGPKRNPPREIRLRFRNPQSRFPSRVEVNGKRWKRIEGDWVILPGDIGSATVVATYGK